MFADQNIIEKCFGLSVITSIEMRQSDLPIVKLFYMKNILLKNM